MENLNKLLDEVYGRTPYLEYTNKTEFAKEYCPTYGEVTKDCTNEIVKHFNDYFNSNTVFYDLGCGIGKMVIHIGLQYSPKKSCGIELSKERIKGAFDLKEKHCSSANNISFIEGDWFSNDFSDATVVYLDNTAMSYSVLEEVCKRLPKGCLLICRKKLLDSEFKFETISDNKFKTGYGNFALYYTVI